MQTPLHVLFVCAMNQWRSPTAEALYRSDPRLSVRSAGVRSGARRRISRGDLDWADLIFVMEREHQQRIREDFRDLELPPIVNLEIPDDFQRYDAELQSLLRAAIDPELGRWLAPEPAALPSMQIRRDDLQGPEIRQLLAEHLRSMHSLSPAESVHALDLTGLQAPDVSFWTVWSEGQLLGCGAMRELSPVHGEVKSMRTATAHLRRGVARTMLTHLIHEARQRGYTRLSLETGTAAAFHPAHALYRSMGFVDCGPFGSYQPDPNSLFLTLSLD